MPQLKNIEIDKDFKSLIPPLQREEYEQLEASLKSEGCRDPLVLWNSFIIDGHNRFEICTRLGIEFKTVAREFPDRAAVKLWMIDNQMGRRNLADIDRIALARKREEILKPAAKANQSKGGGDKKSGSAKLREPIPITPVKSSKEAAKSAGVGERTYDAGKLVLEAAEKGEIPQEDVEAIRRKEKSIHRVAKDIKEKRQKVKREAKRTEAVAKMETKHHQNVHVGDFRELADKVSDDSLSLIFTDPPYDRKAIELFEGLADFAEKKLCEGGSMLCYVGQIQLADAIKILSAKLRLWWTVCCLHSGGDTFMREYGLKNGWKPVLWFVKGTRDNKEDIVRDVMSGGREKSHHEWQQAQSEAEYWIENLCPKDGIVCDPFLGGGTTAAAANKLNRKWVAFEINDEQAAFAIGRLSRD